jgi:hypothetical protein
VWEPVLPSRPVPQIGSYFGSDRSNSGRRNRRLPGLATGASVGPFLELPQVGDSAVRGVADRGVIQPFSITFFWAWRLRQRSPSCCRPTCLTYPPGTGSPASGPAPISYPQDHQPANPGRTGPSLADNGAFPGVKSACPAYRFTRILTGNFGVARPRSTGDRLRGWGEALQAVAPGLAAAPAAGLSSPCGTG